MLAARCISHGVHRNCERLEALERYSKPPSIKHTLKALVRGPVACELSQRRGDHPMSAMNVPVRTSRPQR